MEYLWVLLALIYSIMHSLMSVIDKKILENKKIDTLALSAIRVSINVIIAFIILNSFLTLNFDGINTTVFILSTFYFLLSITYFYAIKSGDISKLIPYRDAIVTILSFILAITLLKETVTTTDILGVIAIALGGYIVLTDGKLAIPKISKGITLIGASAIFLSLYKVTSKISVLQIEPLNLTFFMYLFVAIYFITANILFNRKNLKKTAIIITKDKKYSILIVFASTIAVLGILSLFWALAIEKATKVLPITGTLPLFAVIMGKKLLNEKHGKERIIGTILILIGIFLVYI